jgi:Flp pilus assembly protein TadB
LPSNTPASGERAGRWRPRLSGGRAAALIYIAASFLAALAFWLVTTLTGHYPAVARFGGALWIFILLMIVLMPVVIPWMRRRGQPESEATACPLPEPGQES